MPLLSLSDRERTDLQAIVQSTLSAREGRRAIALLRLDDGDSVEEVADVVGSSRQTVYNWLSRFVERRASGVRARVQDAPRQGRPCTAKGVIDQLIAGVIDSDPREYGFVATGWTAPLLRLHLAEVHGAVVSDDSISRAISRLGLAWKRPRHHLALRSATWRQAKGGSNAGLRGERAQSC